MSVMCALYPSTIHSLDALFLEREVMILRDMQIVLQGGPINPVRLGCLVENQKSLTKKTVIKFIGSLNVPRY